MTAVSGTCPVHMAVQGQNLSSVSHGGAAPTSHRCCGALGILGFSADQVSPSIPTGVASVVVSFFLSMYYNVINAWAFWYLFHSFQVCGHPTAQLGPTVAVEGHSGFSLVLDVAWHHCQLGMGRWKGVKSFRNPGLCCREKLGSDVVLRGLARDIGCCLLLTMEFRSRPGL